jgi:hypothetical protein
MTLNQSVLPLHECATKSVADLATTESFLLSLFILLLTLLLPAVTGPPQK